MNGPMIALIFALKANRPKNCPSLPGGASSMIMVRLTTQVDPIAIPNRHAAIQNVHIGIGTAAISMATASRTAIERNVFLDPILRLMKLKTMAPMMLKAVATMKITRKAAGSKPTTVVAYGCIIAIAVASASLTKKYATMKKNIEGYRRASRKVWYISLYPFKNGCFGFGGFLRSLLTTNIGSANIRNSIPDTQNVWYVGASPMIRMTAKMPNRVPR